MRSAWVSFVLFTVAGAAFAQSAPPPPPAHPASASATADEPTAWACTKQTLLDDVPCTIEGKSAGQPASKEAAKEHRRQAELLGEDVCRALARSGAPDEDAGLLGVCASRMAVATKKCGGDGARRLVDDDGRINPGHARCYGALAGVVRDMIALSETSSTCCACVADRCGASAGRAGGAGGAGKCVERIDAGQNPEASAQCLSTTCSSECAVLQLTTRKP